MYDETNVYITKQYSILGLGLVTSNGKVVTSPHCSSSRHCEYTDATQQECANALCNAQGYVGGSFVTASNNFCNSSYTPDYTYVYRIDMNNVARKKYYAEAMITADCIIEGKLKIKSSLDRVIISMSQKYIDLTFDIFLK